MAKIIMTKGLPGSGKSTWAKKEQQGDRRINRVNKDDLRAMLHDGVHTRDKERFILDIRDKIVRESLSRGHSIIVDDTNFNPVHERALRGMATEFEAEFEIKDFSAVPLDVCIQRDARREKPVGKWPIMRMYKQYLRPDPLVVEYIPGEPSLVICDLDGTLALFGDANPYERNFLDDQINMPVKQILELSYNAKMMVILVSGRNDAFKGQTEEWLKKWNVQYHGLFMRKADDDRKDSIVKAEIYEEHIKGQYNVMFVLDDRDQVVDFWRSQGLTCLQVAEGDF